MLEEKMKDLGDTTLYTGETYVRKKKKRTSNTVQTRRKKEKAVQHVFRLNQNSLSEKRDCESGLYSGHHMHVCVFLSC